MKIEPEDIKIEFFKSSGPGGQHKNKKFTAARVTHFPTGISAVASEQRSQAQNKGLALRRLQEKISRLTKKKKRRIPTKLPKAVKERILESKKMRSRIKQFRQKISKDEW